MAAGPSYLTMACSIGPGPRNSARPARYSSALNTTPGGGLLVCGPWQQGTGLGCVQACRGAAAALGHAGQH